MQAIVMSETKDDIRDPARRGRMSAISKIDRDPMPVELFRDGRGIYGVGVSDLFDYEAVAWSCGVEPDTYTVERPPRALILRPDWFMETKPHRAVLQKIVGGFRRGPFMRSSEDRLRQFIHHEALKRAGRGLHSGRRFFLIEWALDRTSIRAPAVRCGNPPSACRNACRRSGPAIQAARRAYDDRVFDFRIRRRSPLCPYAIDS